METACAEAVTRGCPEVRDRLAAVKALHQAGHPVRVIAARLGVGRSRVECDLEALGLGGRTGPVVARRKALRQLLKTRTPSTPGLARILGCSEETARRDLLALASGWTAPRVRLEDLPKNVRKVKGGNYQARPWIPPARNSNVNLGLFSPEEFGYDRAAAAAAAGRAAREFVKRMAVRGADVWQVIKELQATVRFGMPVVPPHVLPPLVVRLTATGERAQWSETGGPYRYMVRGRPDLGTFGDPAAAWAVVKRDVRWGGPERLLNPAAEGVGEFPATGGCAGVPTDPGGDVFADPGVPDPNVVLETARLVQQIRERVAGLLDLDPAEAARRIGLAEPELDAIARGRTDGVTPEQLARLLDLLDPRRGQP